MPFSKAGLPLIALTTVIAPVSEGVTTIPTPAYSPSVC